MQRSYQIYKISYFDRPWVEPGTPLSLHWRHLKGNKGKNLKLPVQNIQLQDIIVKGVLFIDIIISEILMLEVGIRNQSWDHFGHNPLRRT